MRKYRCPVCGKIISREEMLDVYPCGCDCEYCVEDERGEPVYLRVFHSWVEIV